MPEWDPEMLASHEAFLAEAAKLPAIALQPPFDPQRAINDALATGDRWRRTATVRGRVTHRKRGRRAPALTSPTSGSVVSRMSRWLIARIST